MCIYIYIEWYPQLVFTSRVGTQQRWEWRQTKWSPVRLTLWSLAIWINWHSYGQSLCLRAMSIYPHDLSRYLIVKWYMHYIFFKGLNHQRVPEFRTFGDDLAYHHCGDGEPVRSLYFIHIYPDTHVTKSIFCDHLVILQQWMKHLCLGQDTLMIEFCSTTSGGDRRVDSLQVIQRWNGMLMGIREREIINWPMCFDGTIWMWSSAKMKKH